MELESENIIEKIKENIKMFNKLGQIGGKGTVRRKKKKTNFKLKQRRIKNQDEIKLESIINRINKQVKLIPNEEEYELFQIWFEDNIYLYLDEFSKYEVEKKELLDQIKDDPIELYYNLFTTDQDYLEFISDIDTLRLYLTNSGIEYLSELYKEMENILENKKYLENKIIADNDELTTRECYDHLDLDHIDELTESDLKKAYRKKALLLHPDKHIGEEEEYQDKFKLVSKSYRKLLEEFKSR